MENTIENTLTSRGNLEDAKLDLEEALALVNEILDDPFSSENELKVKKAITIARAVKGRAE